MHRVRFHVLGVMDRIRRAEGRSGQRPGKAEWCEPVSSSLLQGFVGLEHVLHGTEKATVPKEIVRLGLDSLDPLSPASIASIRVGLSWSGAAHTVPMVGAKCVYGLFCDTVDSSPTQSVILGRCSATVRAAATTAGTPLPAVMLAPKATTWAHAPEAPPITQVHASMNTATRRAKTC